MPIGQSSAAAALVVVGSLALSACSSSGSATSSSSTSTTTSAAAASSSTASAAPTGEKVEGRTLAGQMMAAVVKAKTFTSTNDAPPSSQKSTSKVKVNADRTMDAATTIKVGGNTVQAVTLKNGAVTYAKAPAMKLTRWTKLNPKAKDAASRKMSATIGALVTSSAPWNSFGLVQQVPFVKGGTESVNGVQATKYTAEVPASVVLAVTPAEQRSLLSGILGNKTSRLVQWVDAQGRPVKQTLTLDLGAPQAITTTWTGFGGPVSVKAPV